MEIRNKVAIVTGGASGIGRGVCEAFVQRGGRVAIFDRDAERAEQTEAALGKENALAATVNVADEASVAAGIVKTMSRFGAIHVAVNCAGVPFSAKTVDREGKEAALGAATALYASVLVDFWCPVGYVGHVLLGHVLPIALAGVLGFAIGRRVFAVDDGPVRHLLDPLRRSRKS